MSALTAFESHFSARNAALDRSDDDDGSNGGNDKDGDPDPLDLALEVQREVRPRVPLQTTWGLQCIVSRLILASPLLVLLCPTPPLREARR